MDSQQANEDSPRNAKTTQAFLNEYKGNLFEFLLARYFAQKAGFEWDFLQAIPLDYKNLLAKYEWQLKRSDPDLAFHLANLATECGRKISTSSTDEIVGVELMGKNLGQKKIKSEADVVLLTSKGVKREISLKLGKPHSFINTKSAGIRSFYNGYFPFAGEGKQILLNQYVDLSFEQMARSLYEIANLTWTGQFDDHWIEAGYGNLPGELPELMRKVVLEHYHRLIGKIYEDMSYLFEQDKVLFTAALAPLMGFAHDKLIQVKAYYAHGAHLDSVKVLTWQDISKNMNSIELLPLKNGLSSFELRLNELRLQIRVKPMNIFTVPAVKINCSVKEEKPCTRPSLD
jgi:hypothetical protein